MFFSVTAAAKGSTFFYFIACLRKTIFFAAWLQVDYNSTFIKPSFWTTAQRTKVTAAMVSHNVKVDLYMLCQIAAMQARRYDLFVTRAIDRNIVMF